MSRIGKKAVRIPEGVKVEVLENNLVKVKGKLGELEFRFDPRMEIAVSDADVRVSRHHDTIIERELHGTTRALINNMITGVTQGFQKGLVIDGVGYKMVLKGDVLVVSAGYSHPFEVKIPEGLKVTCPTPLEATIFGIDKQKVTEFAAEVRMIRKPEPYKGHGIRYKGEVIRRKEGKKAK